MATLVFSTCGTSALTNRADQDTRALLIQTANCKDTDLAADQKARMDARIATVATTLEQSDLEQAGRISAELNGLIRFYDGRPAPDGNGRPDHHVLICTDTYQGQAVGALVEDWIKRRGFTAGRLAVRDLATDDLDRFRVGLSDLARQVVDLGQGYRAHRYRIVFNLTGGFKAIQGFMQTLGNLYADECIYVFEGSRALLRIPRLPISVDPDGTISEKARIALRRLANRLGVSSADAADIPDALLWQLEGGIALSEYCEALWPICRDRWYGSALQPPLSDKVGWENAFEKTVAELPSDRRMLINLRLDQLAVHLERPDGANLRSLDLKPLKGTPVDGCTHEFDAWADKDARRCFGAFDDTGRFIVKKLDRALH